MGRELRMYSQDGFYFVTAKTTQSRLLLRPSKETNEVVGGVLARAARRHGVKVFGFVVMSTHLHLLVQVRDGGLSRFMQYLLSNIAKKVGRLVKWPGAFWKRRFTAEAVLDDAAMVNRLAYIVAHGVKEGLVERVTDWPGLSCVPQLLGSGVRSFKWYRWSKRWEGRALRRDAPAPFDDRLAEEEQLTLAVLPSWEGLAPAVRIERVRWMIAKIERRGSTTSQSPKPAARICRRHPHTRLRPTKKHRPRPHALCHASTREARRARRAQYREFVAAYRSASVRFRSGDLLAPFPPFSFRPPLMVAARQHEALSRDDSPPASVMMPESGR